MKIIYKIICSECSKVVKLREKPTIPHPQTRWVCEKCLPKERLRKIEPIKLLNVREVKLNKGKENGER